MAVTTSCVDDDKLQYSFEKPASIAGYEYLADYDALKTYVNRDAAPGFKLGGALAAADYNADGLITRLANANFDEIVAGNAMKMASCVNDKGVMDFDACRNVRKQCHRKWPERLWPHVGLARPAACQVAE